jgi:DNA-binding protein HU-beta
LNKAELIDSIAASADLSKAAAGRALDGFIDSVTKALKDEGTVSLVGFGSFQVQHRAARAGRNPQTGLAIQIGATKNPTFKAGSLLKKSCN